MLRRFCLGTSVADEPKQPDMVPRAEVAQATAELIAAGQRVLEERNEALDEVKQLRERLFNCESARST